MPLLASLPVHAARAGRRAIVEPLILTRRDPLGLLWSVGSRKRRPYAEGHRRLEKILSLFYAGGWAARAWQLVPGATRVHLEEHALAVGRDPGRPPLRLAFA